MEPYYMPGACSLTTHIVLEWIGKPYDTHRLSHDELKTNAYLSISPAGAVSAHTGTRRLGSHPERGDPELSSRHLSMRVTSIQPMGGVFVMARARSVAWLEACC